MIKLFGTTIRETVDAFDPIHFGDDQSTGTKDDKTKAIGRIIITCLMIFLATYLFMHQKDAPAGTIIGAVVGYWIK